MARIRTIKPEFWTSEQIVDCSTTARLTFIGLWNFSDDNGIHPASVKRLKMEIFPSDDISGEELQAVITELIAAQLITCYEVAGTGYWQVTGWKKHQKIEKPTFRHPLPEGAVSAENSPTPRREVVDMSPTPRLTLDPGMESNGSKPMSGKPDALSVLAYLNAKTGRNYQPVKANISLITARLADGATKDECCAVIDAKVDAWNGDAKMREYLRPETLFGATKFAGYVGQLSNSGSSAGKDYL